MKIRAKGGSLGDFFFEASDEAAKELIASGNYEAVDETEVRTADAKPVDTRPAKPVKRTRG